MVACPRPTPVTTPYSSTTATFSFVLSHFTPVMDASAGFTVAVSCAVVPMKSVLVSAVTVTPVTGVMTMTR